VIEHVSAAVDALLAIDVGALGDEDLAAALVAVARQRARLEAAEAQLTAAWDARRGWAVDGARSGTAWLAWRCHLPRRDAHRQVRLARFVQGAPAVEAAWRAGEIGSAQVGLLARACTDRTEADFGRDEDVLVAAARELRFSELTKVVTYWAQHADPDGVEDRAARQRDRRRLHLSQTVDGTWVGDVLLDPLGGAAVAETLRSIEDELFAADRAEAVARLGEGATTADLARTPAQRRADALVEMAVRARTSPSDGRRPAPLFTVLVGYETFAGRICELANGTAVTPGALAPWISGADIERIVFEGRSRVVDVGAHTRFFVGADRRAIEVRDRTCYHPTCEQASHLQVDHIRPWAAGGATTIANGRLACGHHNRLRNQAGNAGDEPP
jgi:hypothetical protein